MKKKLFIVDDDEEIRTQMSWAFRDEYDIETAEDRVAALSRYRDVRPDVTLLDLGLPPSPNSTVEGMATLGGILSFDRLAKVIIISGQDDRENAVEAVGSGAYDFHCKPVDVEELGMILKRAIHITALEREYRDLQQDAQPDRFEGMLGSSNCMRDVFAAVEKVAATTAPVLILGESGTGKEMIAGAIHRRSKLSGQPFVAANCNAIPENLIESELFGHEKGAFTGADRQRIGIIESARGGTLFLDEIGDLPPPVQVKLLRFLQEKRIHRVGGREEIEVEARVIAATNVDLEAAMKSGEFREDLYFRLAVVVCKVPALRERGDDILLIARDFLRSFAEQNGRDGLSFDKQAEQAIRVAPWPGNVRELQNRVQRAVIMADGDRIRPGDLELDGDGDSAVVPSLKEAREAVEREAVERALQRHGGNVSAAAGELGVSRPTLYELMDKLGIERKKS